MSLKKPDSALTKPRLSVLSDSLLGAVESKRANPRIWAADAPAAAIPQAPKSPANPHKPRPAEPPTRNKMGHSTQVDPAALLGEESLIQSMAQLDDPHAQPELPVELMDYTPGALEYRYGYVRRGNLFGPSGVPHYTDVRLNLSKDGALGAALAAVVACSPKHITTLIEPARPQGTVRGALHSRSTAGATYEMLVDCQVPVRQDGAPMGHSRPPRGPLPLWHLLLAKMISKLDQVLIQAKGENLDPLGPQHELADIAAFMHTLTGKPVQTAVRDARGRQWSAALRTLLQSSEPRAIAVTFCDTQDMGRMECEDGVLTNAFGGLGMHVQNARTNVILLSKHHYALVAVDPQRQRVQLYNPLGWNPDPKALQGGTRAQQFMAPEQLDALPKVPGTFWLSNSLLTRIGLTLSFCDLLS